MSRYLLAAVLAAIIAPSAVLPAVATADVRQGIRTDVLGDSTLGPNRDIERVTASYDQGGAWSVTVRFAAALTSDASAPSMSVRLANDTGSDQRCSGNSSASATMSASISTAGGAPFFSTTAPGANNYEANRVLSADGRELQFYKSDVRLKDWGYVCVQVRLLATGVTADTLDFPLYFNGYEPEVDGDKVPWEDDLCRDAAGPATTKGCPDTDNDGIADSADQCPTAAGPAPAGCPAQSQPSPPATGGTPPAAVSPTPSDPTPAPAELETCAPKGLKGKTLAKAKSVLKSAGCKLGKVTKPKKTKSGYKLVVSKFTVRKSGKVDLSLRAVKR